MPISGCNSPLNDLMGEAGWRHYKADVSAVLKSLARLDALFTFCLIALFMTFCNLKIH